jgi:hypothetical protein
MKGSLFNTYLTVLFLFFVQVGAKGQIFDFSKNMPYQKVFIDTDNFNFSYLDTLAANWEKVEEDTIRLSILNDLAYYWHTRNLNTSLAYSKQGLSLCSSHPIWQERYLP